MFEDALGHQVRLEHLQILVRDEERDIVAVGHDVLHQWVVERTAQHIAVDALHRMGP